MPTNQKKSIAFLGLGTMGVGMAGRLAGAGYALAVYNRNAARSEEFAAAMAGKAVRVAKSPAEAARGAEVIISMVADDPASRAVWLGEQGALSGTAAGTICLDSSTLTVTWVRELAGLVEKKGSAFLDAPVTGTKPHAANGELVFLVGGKAETLEAVRPLLAVMSKDIVHVGSSTAGAELKLINNFVCGVQAAAFAEASAMVAKSGLDPEKALGVLVNGAPGSFLVKTIASRHAAKDYSPKFQLKLMAKDIGYAIEEAKRHGVVLTCGAAALTTFKQAMAAGLGDEDMSAVVKFLQR